MRRGRAGTIILPEGGEVHANACHWHCNGSVLHSIIASFERMPRFGVRHDCVATFHVWRSLPSQLDEAGAGIRYSCVKLTRRRTQTIRHARPNASHADGMAGTSHHRGN